MRIAALFLSAILVLFGAPAPQRIISTAPSITEVLFAMGLGPRVVGVTIYDTYPPEVRKLPKIGAFVKFDLEAVSALHPDLVVVYKQPNRADEQLNQLRIPHISVSSEDLDAIYAGARAIGHATHEEAAAERLVNDMQNKLQQIKTRTSKLKHPTVAFLVGRTPGELAGLVATGAGSYFGDLITIAGGTNVFADTKSAYFKVSLEEIISRNPDLILELSGDETPKQEELLSLWRRHPSLKAVSTGKVFALPSGPFNVPGPRAVNAATLVAHYLHPELAL